MGQEQQACVWKQCICVYDCRMCIYRCVIYYYYYYYYYITIIIFLWLLLLLLLPLLLLLWLLLLISIIIMGLYTCSSKYLSAPERCRAEQLDSLLTLQTRHGNTLRVWHGMIVVYLEVISVHWIPKRTKRDSLQDAVSDCWFWMALARCIHEVWRYACFHSCSNLFKMASHDSTLLNIT
jgi:hypothetical protein